MNTVHTAKAAVLVAVVSASAFAAADVQPLVVQASVSGVCKFGTIPALDFGAIDPSLVAGNLSATSLVQYRCTKGTVPTALSAAAGPYTMTDALVAGSSLPFTLSLPAPNTLVGAGFSVAASTFTITGQILQADAQDAMAATYTKSVSLTITP